ncbi:MAG TPA: histidine kinase [Candidatus Limnocylindrales bacterium]
MTDQATLPALAERTRDLAAQLAAELAEIELLVQQARTEANRHEQKRAAAAERLQSLGEAGDPAEVAELARQLVALTRRAGLMEAQVDVLAGKHKVLTRFREAVAAEQEALDGLVGGPAGTNDGGLPALLPGSAAAIPLLGGEGAEEAHALPPALSRVVMGAQEDLRRDIARAMHDGPLQSLTNIVLQAQIVDRLLARDAAAAAPEVRQLVAMVQQTLEATKSFIFDVRPMVLDDLGLVPTVRRAAQERSRRARIPVEFESLGADRRLPMDVESALFRILDEATAGYLAAAPDRVLIRLDWSERLEARVTAVRDEAPSEAADATPERERGRGFRLGRGREKERELPAALAAMIEEQQAAERAARTPAPIRLPSGVWREIQQRATPVGLEVRLDDDGRELVIVLEAAG